SSTMSPERVDKGLYEIQWIAHTEIQSDQPEKAAASDSLSWLVFLDGDGIGTTVADRLRRSGHRVRVVLHQPVTVLTKIDGGYALNPRRPEQLNRLLQTQLENEGDLAGIIYCWPLDICAHTDGQLADAGAEMNDHLGVFTILQLAKTFAELDTLAARLYVITANAQPARGTERLAVERATVWGLGRVVGHQEFVNRWGGLIDIDDADDHTDTASRICEHILSEDPEDQ